MLSEGYITQAQYDQARSEAIDASYHTPEIAFSAPTHRLLGGLLVFTRDGGVDAIAVFVGLLAVAVDHLPQAQYDQARSEAIDASYHTPEIAFSAPYLSEMVRVVIEHVFTHRLLGGLLVFTRDGGVDAIAVFVGLLGTVRSGAQRSD
jgi:hypothetical protein